MTMLRKVFLQALALAAVLTDYYGESKAPQPRHCGGNVRHVHLSVGPDPSTQMIVSFASTPSNLAAPVGGVLVGTSPSQLDRVIIEEETGSFYNVTVRKGR